MATTAHSQPILPDATDVLHNLSLDPKTKPLATDSENKLQGAFGGNGNGYLLDEKLVEATKTGKPSLDSIQDKGTNPRKLGYQSSAYSTKGSYGKGGGAYSYGYYSPAYQYPSYGYSGSYASGKTNSLHYPSYLAQPHGKSNGAAAQSYGYAQPHGKSTGAAAQSYGYMDNIYSNYGMYGPYMNSIGAGYGYGSYGYDAWKNMPNWYAVNNRYKTRSYGYGKENIEGLNELNRGPRAKGFKSHEVSKVMTTTSTKETETEKPLEEVSRSDLKDYNKNDFPETYTEAKFFIIKSYSEDDIHKSIKYNVWSSTPNGNKKLDASYNEAKQNSNGCPVFLLFSVNTSGQFVGLAEMVGPVDFNKTLEYWQQDKWIGCFPVKWHIVKDIPNGSLRHITLENNENKPVTNSRDTQEVKLEQGNKVVKIFKDHVSKTCILDDFVFYETRQKIIQEGKNKHSHYKKQHASVANGDKGNNNVIPKDILEKPQESTTTASQDAAAPGDATKETTAESKEVKENGSVATACAAVKENGSIATACA